MLLDINAYVGHWPFKQLQYNTCDALLERMNKFGVDVSAVSNLNGIFYKNTQSANEELYDEIKSNRRFRDRFVPFTVINPIYAGWKYDLEVCLRKFGMKGVRLYPKYHDYELTDPSCIEAVKAARDRGLPVAFSLRMVDYRQRSWMDIENEWELKDVVPIVREVPDAKYIILNIANGTSLNDEDENLFKNADIVFDTSGRAISNLGELIKKYGKDKFVFGTHSPILDYLTGLLRIESLREDEADEAAKELMLSGNARRILGV
ncbi:amidohydrolase family protein [bacterium]|nr:amidohydrolase family protein [bacterium]